eukprot:219941-Amphidinium_carterae.1
MAGYGGEATCRTFVITQQIQYVCCLDRAAWYLPLPVEVDPSPCPSGMQKCHLQTPDHFSHAMQT